MALRIASGGALLSHVRPVPERGYLFGDDARREGERLAAVERTFDGLSQSTLLEVGVEAGWACWEVGAGRGSMARWLSRIVGPDGRVLATDLEDEWFDPGLADITFMRHDIVLDPLPEGHFDLVHARFLLEHVADPAAVIRRLRDALRLGGVLVLEDSAGLQIDVIPATPVFGRLAPAWERAGLAMGWNATYGLSLMSDLRSTGFVELRGREVRLLAPGGDGWTHVRSGLQRLHAQLIEQGVAEQEIEHALHSLADPANVITGPPDTVSWGRRMN